MAKIDLLSLTEDNLIGGIQQKKIMIYGSNDCGKTFQATKFEKPLLLMTESGGGALKVKKLPINKWSEFKTVVEELTNPKTFDKMFDVYKTVVIDTAENLVDESEKATCNEFGVRDLSEIQGRLNGYKIARNDFAAQINKLTSSGYCVVFICHEETVEKTDPVTEETYAYTQPKGTSNEKSSMRMLRDLCDFAIYVRPNGIDPETYETIPSTAICKETKTSFARSRFAIQTFVDPFTASGLIEAIEKAIEKSAENEGAEVEKYIQKKQSYTKEDYFEMITPYIKVLSKNYSSDISAIIATELGDGRKITSATDDEIIALDNIYNRLVTLATSLDITV